MSTLEIKFNFAEKQIVVGKELVRQFVELIANYDDETYINDFYEVTDEFEDEILSNSHNTSVVWYYCYRSDIVGYVGEMNIFGKDESLEWTPHFNIIEGK